MSNDRAEPQPAADTPAPQKVASTAPTGETSFGGPTPVAAGNAAIGWALQAKLSVGAVDDPLEREADANAKVVVARLQRQSNDEALGLRADDLLRSAPRISRRVDTRSPAAGPDGGEVDSQTQGRLARQGSGRPLEPDTRQNFESAMGLDLSSVRIHRDSDLAPDLGAKAFTHGSNIHFAPGQFDTASTGGKELLAHELTHVAQQGNATVHRWPWTKKAKKEVEKNAPAAAAPMSEGTKAGIEAARNAGRNAVNAPAQPPPPAEYKGTAVKGASSKGEAGKPIAAASVAGGAGAIGGYSSIGASQPSLGVPVAGAVLGPILLGDTAAGIRSARKMQAEGKQQGDHALVKRGDRKKKEQSVGFGSAALATTRAGIDIANVSKNAGSLANAATFAEKAERAVALGSTGLGVAGAAVGIAAGSVQVIQGVWRGGKAVQKLCRLTWGRGAEMLSERGKRWRKFVQGQEGLKVAINGAKIALGALGIAAGALMLASNPIGWAVGIAAGIAGGFWALKKIRGKYKDAKTREKAAKKIAAGARAESLDDGAEVAKSPDAGKQPADAEARQLAIERANEVAKEASKAGEIAVELAEATHLGELDLVQQYLDTKAEPDKDDGLGQIDWPQHFLYMMDGYDRSLHDALMVLSSINVSHEQAMSDSGVTLIEEKLNLTNAM